MNFYILTPLILLVTVSFLLTNTALAADNDKVVILHTNFGPFVIEFFPDDAPATVENFLKLTESGFYENTAFHRIIKDFMIQGGDPLSKKGEDGFTNIAKWGTGDTGYTISAEFNSIKHDRGIVSMARGTDVNSASSQFFIVHKAANFLDGQYTVFGRLLTQESYDTLDKMATMGTTSRDIPHDLFLAEITKTEIVTRADIENPLDSGEQARMSTEEIPAPQNISGRFISDEYNFSLKPPDGWKVVIPQPDSGPDDPMIAFIGPGKETGQFDRSGGTSLASPFIYVNVNKLDDHSFEEHLNSRVSQYHTMKETGTLDIQSEKLIILENVYGSKYLTFVTFATQSTGGGNMLPFAQAILSHGDFVYGITYANHSIWFDDDSFYFHNIVSSFAPASDKSTPVSDFNQIMEESGIEITTQDSLAELEELRMKAIEEKAIEEKAIEMETSEQQGGGCLIATATFGSEMAPQVQLLREIRDNMVLQTESGSAFVTTFNQFYYSFSPTIADYERENPTFREAVKLTLTPLLTSLALLQYADIDSESEMLGYGIGIILLNIGMYFVAPIALVMKVRSFYKLQ